MSDWGLADGGFVFVEDAPFVSMAPFPSANVKGSWTQLIAATAAQWDRLRFADHGFDSTAGWLTDIGVGGSGSETVLIANLMGASTSTTMSEGVLTLPCNIPAGTRISARIQNVSGSGSAAIGIAGFAASFASPQNVGGYTTMGANTATSLGVNTGAPNSATPSWVEIASATTAQFSGLIATIVTTQNAAEIVFFEIAVGGSGSEVVIFRSHYFTNRGNGYPSKNHDIRVPIPAGVRLSARVTSYAGGANFSYMTLIGY